MHLKTRRILIWVRNAQLGSINLVKLDSYTIITSMNRQRSNSRSSSQSSARDNGGSDFFTPSKRLFVGGISPFVINFPYRPKKMNSGNCSKQLLHSTIFSWKESKTRTVSSLLSLAPWKRQRKLFNSAMVHKLPTRPSLSNTPNQDKTGRRKDSVAMEATKGSGTMEEEKSLVAIVVAIRWVLEGKAQDKKTTIAGTRVKINVEDLASRNVLKETTRGLVVRIERGSHSAMEATASEPARLSRGNLSRLRMNLTTERMIVHLWIVLFFLLLSLSFSLLNPDT